MRLTNLSPTNNSKALFSAVLPLLIVHGKYERFYKHQAIFITFLRLRLVFVVSFADQILLFIFSAIWEVKQSILDGFCRQTSFLWVENVSLFSHHQTFLDNFLSFCSNLRFFCSPDFNFSRTKLTNELLLNVPDLQSK